MKVKNEMEIDRRSTLFLKLILAFLSLGASALSIFLLYNIITNAELGDYRPILIGVVISMMPFLYIFYQSHQLLSLIDQNSSLSNEAVKALKSIKISSFVISGIYLIGAPFIYIVAERDDAPGVILIDFILIIGPFAVGVFASILQKLLLNAMGYKSENELTI